MLEQIRQGDVMIIDFNPQAGHEQAGHEQAGRRPAVVISNHLMNDHFPVIMACPITHTKRNNPFHVELVGYDFVDGYVMCDQVKTMDARSRNYRTVGRLKEDDIGTVLERVEMLIEKET